MNDMHTHVLALWDAGYSAEEIADITGVDLAEIHIVIVTDLEKQLAECLKQ